MCVLCCTADLKLVKQRASLVPVIVDEHQPKVASLVKYHRLTNLTFFRIFQWHQLVSHVGLLIECHVYREQRGPANLCSCIAIVLRQHCPLHNRQELKLRLSVMLSAPGAH